MGCPDKAAPAPCDRRLRVRLAQLMLAAAFLPWASDTPGQTPHRTHVVGYWGLWNEPGRPAPVTPKTRRGWFEDGLARQGFVVGKNLRIEYVFTGFDSAGDIALQAKELLAKKPDLIYVVDGVPGRREAIRALSASVPMTFDDAPEEMVEQDLGDLRRPANNMTGVALKYGEWAEKRLEIVRELLPRAGRVLVVTDAELWGPFLGRLQAAGRRLGLEVAIGDVSRHGRGMRASVAEGNAALAATLAEALRSPPDAFMAYGSFNATERGRQFTEFERDQRIPYIGDGNPVTRGVVGYGMDYKDHEERLFVIMAKILKGTRPVDIPVESTSKFLLTVDLKRAREIGVAIPPAILVRADTVFK